MSTTAGTETPVAAARTGWCGYSSLPTRYIVLDLAERAIILAMFANFVVTMVGRQGASLNAVVALLVLSETLPVALIFMRGPSASMSVKPLDWVFGIAGSCIPFLAMSPQSLTPFLPQVGAMLIIVGLACQIAAKLALGRSFGLVAANRGVKTVGPYRYVRHPMYAGYSIGHVGFLVAYPSWYNAMLYGAVLLFQILRMNCEERILANDESYREMSSVVRYRLVPGVY